MLAENYKLQVIKTPQIPAELWQKLNLTTKTLEKLSPDEIYDCVKNLIKSTT